MWPCYGWYRDTKVRHQWWDLISKHLVSVWRGEQLEARVTAEQKKLIEFATALQDSTATDFVPASAREAVRRAIENHQILNLSLRDSQEFAQALTKPQPVNDRLRDTVRQYRRKTGI
jgi:uncharacterized protein (DUF1778 family)